MKIAEAIKFGIGIGLGALVVSTIAAFVQSLFRPENGETAICPVCGTQMSLPKSYVGGFICPGCKSALEIT